MEREFLKKLNLTDEDVEKVMAENGKDLKAEQERQAEKTEKKIEAKQKEIDLINAQLADANKTIKSYKDMKIDEVKQSAEEWEQKAKQLKADLEKNKKEMAIELALSKTDAHDTSVIKALIDADKLVFKEDKLFGLDEQLEDLRKNKSFLFAQKEEETEDKDTSIRFQSDKKTKSQGALEITKEQFQNMGYFERLELKKNDAELYQQLKGE